MKFFYVGVFVRPSYKNSTAAGEKRCELLGKEEQEAKEEEEEKEVKWVVGKGGVNVTAEDGEVKIDGWVELGGGEGEVISRHHIIFIGGENIYVLRYFIILFVFCLV